MRGTILLFALALGAAFAFSGCKGEEGTPDAGGEEVFCEGIDCSGHGECHEDEVRAWCECEDGYTAHMWNCVPLQTDADGDGDVEVDSGDDADVEGDADAETDARPDAEADIEADAEVEVDLETDADAEVDAEL